MNNTINGINNITFNARYVEFRKSEKIPEKIKDAIYKSNAVDEFINAGKPKTIWEKLVSLFKKDEALEVTYIETIVPLPKKHIPKELLHDPYAKACNLLFLFKGKDGFYKQFPISSEQVGIRRQAGSVPKLGEHHTYKPPIETAEDKLVKKIEELTDLNSLLTSLKK